MNPNNESRIIELPKITDPRGNLTFIDGNRNIPFPIRRAYWIYDTPGGETRSGHAYQNIQEFFISLSGSFDIVLDDGSKIKSINLNRSYYGLYVPKMIWRHLENFSSNAVCVVLASLPYSEEDYIRDYELFLRLQNEKTPDNNR